MTIRTGRFHSDIGQMRPITEQSRLVAETLDRLERPERYLARAGADAVRRLIGLPAAARDKAMAAQTAGEFDTIVREAKSQHERDSRSPNSVASASSPGRSMFDVYLELGGREALSLEPTGGCLPEGSWKGS